MNNKKGVTLVSLVITIIVLLILATVSIYAGTGTIRYANFNKAKAEMQTISTQVNLWNEEYINVEVKEDEIGAGQTREQVKAIKQQAIIEKYGVTTNDSSCDQTLLNTTVQVTGITAANYRFLSEEYLKQNLGLDASFEYLINIISKDVILLGGISYNGQTYYTLNDFEITNVESNLPSSISFNVVQGENTDVIISDLKLIDSNSNEAEISKFIVEYKKTTDEIWSDATTNVTKFTDAEDNNKTKYKFSLPEITNNSVLNIEYNVKISTLDRNIEYSQIIKVESNNYVNSGLILHLDGINNTGNGHSNTTTTWKDLSNTGEDAVLNNIATEATLDSGWGDNYLAFDGINDFVSATRASSGDFTIEILAKNIEVINDREFGSLFMINTWSSTATTTSIQLFKDLREDSKRFQYRILVPATENDTYRETGLFYDFDNDNGLYVISKDDSKVNIYLDGNKVYEFSNNAFISRINVIAMNVEIGRWYHSIAPTKQRVYSFRIYNKALTDEEIKHNYRIDKYRFEL